MFFPVFQSDTHLPSKFMRIYKGKNNLFDDALMVTFFFFFYIIKFREKGIGLSTERIVWISITKLLVFIILVLALVLLVKWCSGERQECD